MKCVYPLRKQLIMDGVMVRIRTGTTRRYFRRLLEDVVVRRISGNVGCISVEIFMIISSVRNIPRLQFERHISN
jgi:hypothetical protein